MKTDSRPPRSVLRVLNSCLLICVLIHSAKQSLLLKHSGVVQGIDGKEIYPNNMEVHGESGRLRTNLWDYKPKGVAKPSHLRAVDYFGTSGDRMGNG